MRIVVTRNFDKLDPIDYLTLRDGIEIPPDCEFALGYTILEGSRDKPTKIHVHEVSLVAVPYRPAKKEPVRKRRGGAYALRRGFTDIQRG